MTAEGVLSSDEKKTGKSDTSSPAAAKSKRPAKKQSETEFSRDYWAEVFCDRESRWISE